MCKVFLPEWGCMAKKRPLLENRYAQHTLEINTLVAGRWLAGVHACYRLRANPQW